jgi:hypothetical protein
MKKVIVLLIILLNGFSLNSSSNVVPNPCPKIHCQWDDIQFDCYLDSSGMSCLDMKAPVPFSVYVPCGCCNEIIAKD